MTDTAKTMNKCGGKCNCKCKGRRTPEPARNTRPAHPNDAAFKQIDFWMKWIAAPLVLLFMLFILGILHH